MKLDQYQMPEDADYVDADYDDYDEDNYDAAPADGGGNAGGELMIYTPKQELMVRTQKITKKVSLAGVITVPILALIILIAIISGIVAIKKFDQSTLEKEFEKVVTSGKTRAKPNSKKEQEYDADKILTVPVRSLNKSKVNFSQYFTTSGEAFEFQAFEVNDASGVLDGSRVKNNEFNFRDIFHANSKKGSQEDDKKLPRYCVKVINKAKRKHLFVMLRFTFDKLFTIHTLDGEDNHARAFTVSKDTLMQRIEVEKNVVSIFDSICKNEAKEEAENGNGVELNITDKLKLDHQEWYLDEARTELFNPKTASEAKNILRERFNVYSGIRNRLEHIDQIQLIYTKKLVEKDQPSVYTNLSSEEKAAKNYKNVFDTAIQKFTEENRDKDGNDIYRLDSIKFYTLDQDDKKQYLDDSYKSKGDNKLNIPQGTKTSKLGLGQKYTIYLEAERKALTFNFYETFSVNQIDENLIDQNKMPPKNIDTPSDGKLWNISEIAKKFVDEGTYEKDAIYGVDEYQIAWKYRNKDNQLKFLEKQDGIDDEKGIDENKDIDTTTAEEVRLYPHKVAFPKFKVLYKEGSVHINGSDHNYFSLKGRRDDKISDTIAYLEGISKAYKTEELLGTSFPINESEFKLHGLFFKTQDGHEEKLNENDTFKDILAKNPNLTEVELRYSHIPVNLSYNLKKASESSVSEETLLEGEVWVARDKKIYDITNKVLKNNGGTFEEDSDRLIGKNGKASLISYFAKDHTEGADKISTESEYFGNYVDIEARFDKVVSELSDEQKSDLVLKYELNKVKLSFYHYDEKAGKKEDQLAVDTLEEEFGKTLKVIANNKENFTFDRWFLGKDSSEDKRKDEFKKEDYAERFTNQPISKPTSLEIKDNAYAFYKRMTNGKVVIRQIYTNNKNNDKVDPNDIQDRDIKTSIKEFVLENVPLGLNFEFEFSTSGDIKLKPFNSAEVSKNYDIEEVAKRYFDDKEIKNKFPLKINPDQEYGEKNTKKYFEISSATKLDYKEKRSLDQTTQVLEYDFVYTRKRATFEIKYDSAASAQDKLKTYEYFLGRKLIASDIPLIETVKGQVFEYWTFNSKKYNDSTELEQDMKNGIIKKEKDTISATCTDSKVAIYPYFVKSDDLRSEDNKFIKDDSLWNEKDDEKYKYGSNCIPYKQDGRHKAKLVKRGTFVNDDKAKFERPTELPQELIEQGFEFKHNAGAKYIANIKDPKNDTTPKLDNVDVALRVLIPIIRKKANINFRKPTYLGSDYVNNATNPTNYIWLAQTKITGKDLTGGLDNLAYIGQGDSSDETLKNKGLDVYKTTLYDVSATEFYIVPKGENGQLVDKIDPSKHQPIKIEDFLMPNEEITIEPVMKRKKARVNIYAVELDTDDQLPSRFQGKTALEMGAILKEEVQAVASKELEVGLKHELNFAPARLGFVGKYSDFNEETRQYTFVKQEVNITPLSDPNATDTQEVHIAYIYQRKKYKVSFFHMNGKHAQDMYFNYGFKFAEYLEVAPSQNYKLGSATGSAIPSNYTIFEDIKVYFEKK